MKKYWYVIFCIFLAAINLPFVVTGHIVNAISMGCCLAMALVYFGIVRGDSP